MSQLPRAVRESELLVTIQPCGILQAFEISVEQKFSRLFRDLQEAQDSLGVPFPIPLIGNEGPGVTDFLDTNGDGWVDGTDDPSVVPVTVRVRWRSRNGIVTQYYSTVLGTR